MESDTGEADVVTARELVDPGPARRPSGSRDSNHSGERQANRRGCGQRKGRERGLKAGNLVRVAAKVLKGGGGGKPDIAQGPGTEPLATIDALREVTRVIGQTVSQ